MNELHKQQIERGYNAILNKEISYFFYNKLDGCINYSLGIIHLIPGSFNPLHGGHRNLSKSVKDCFGRFTAYELSLKRREKEPLSLDDLITRLEQFEEDEFVVITNADFFARKAGCFRKEVEVHFHLGYDTAVRILSDDTKLGIQGIRANFWVYDRGDKTYNDLPEKPSNMLGGNLCSNEFLNVSSTQIRQNNRCCN